MERGFWSGLMTKLSTYKDSTQDLRLTLGTAERMNACFIFFSVIVGVLASTSVTPCLTLSSARERSDWFSAEVPDGGSVYWSHGPGTPFADGWNHP